MKQIRHFSNGFHHLAALMTALFCMVMFCVVPVRADDTPPIPVDASCQVVILEADNGQILSAQNETAPVAPYKMIFYLTALTAYENADMTDEVTVPSDLLTQLPEDADVIYLEPGEVLTVRDLIGALLYNSANDAAYTLACHISGSPEEFAALMNETARAHGADASHFSSIYDLPDPDAYTNARDIARIARALWQIEPIREMISADLLSIQPTNKTAEARYYANPLDMRAPGTDRFYSYALGGKSNERQILSFSASEQMSMIMLILGETDEDDAYDDMHALLKYGYEYFQKVTLDFDGHNIARLPVYQAEDKLGYADIVLSGQFVYYAEIFSRKPADPEGLANFFTHELTLPERLEAPVHAGDPVGTLTYTMISDPTIKIEMKPFVGSSILAEYEKPSPIDNVVTHVGPFMGYICAGLALIAVILLWNLLAPVIRKKLHRPKPY